MSAGIPTVSRSERVNSFSQKQPSRTSRSAESILNTVTPRPPFLQLRTHSSPLLPRAGDPVVPESRASLDSVYSIRDDPFFRIYQSPQSLRLAKEVAQNAKAAPLRKDTSFFDSEILPPEDSREAIGSSTKGECVNGNRKVPGSSAGSQQTRDRSSGSIRDQLPRLDVLGGPGRAPTIRSLEKTPTKAASDRSPLDRSWSSEVSGSLFVRKATVYLAVEEKRCQNLSI
jgi:hypothetical protein